MRMGLTGPEWARVAAMAAVIIGLHLVGWVDPTRKVHWLTFEPIRVAIAAFGDKVRRTSAVGFRVT
jgi:hypothetical protein